MTELTQQTSDAAIDRPQPFIQAVAVLREAVAQRAFPGAAFGVLWNGRIVAMEAVGRFTYDESSPPVTPSTIFDIASLTKVVATTSAAMILCDRQRLELDLPLGEILPGFVIGKEAGSRKEAVTLRMLLAHSSGLPAYERLFESAHTPYELLRACLLMPLEAAPMERMIYSDIGFLLLGKALEVVAEESLNDFCSREIFQPLGLADTRFCIPKELRSSIPPTENDTTFRHRIVQGEVNDENCAILNGCAGHAGLFSCVPDLLRFAKAILSPAEQPSIFRPETVSTFAMRRVFPHGTTRALGWDTTSHPSSSGTHFGPRSIGHLGFTGTSLWIDPDRRLAVVLLTNRTWPDRSSQAIKVVRPAFHDAIVSSLT